MRREFRYGLALAALASIFAAPALEAQAPATTTIKIIALNDFHGNLTSPGNFQGSAALPSVPSGGVDFLAGYVASLKAQNPNNVVVSAGDLIGASPLVSALFHDEGTIEVMNRLGLEFNAVGNHEFDDGRAELLRMQNGGCYTGDANTCLGAKVGTPVPFEGARFKFLAANVTDTATGKTVFPPYMIKSFGNLRVAFIGMTLKETPTIVTPAGVAGLRFDDEADTVNQLVPKLRARGVEAVVVLIHQGGFQTIPPSIVDINGCAGGLAGSPIADIVGHLNPGVDLVISGHTHAAYNCRVPNAMGVPIPVTSASSFGRVLTDIDMTLDARSGRVVAVAARNLVVDRTNAQVVPNAEIQGIVTAYGSLVAPIANQVLGSITQDVPNATNAACEVPAGDLIADAQLAATSPAGLGGAQFALMNPGGVRASGFVYTQSSGGEAPGDVTFGEAFTVQPFGNSLVTMTLAASDLKDVLEQQFPGCLGQTVQRVLQISNGLRVTWDGTQAACQKVRDVTLTTPSGMDIIVQGGIVVDPARAYRITVNNFLATGGDGFTALTRGTNLLGGAQDLDALIVYLSRYQRPNAPYNPLDASLGLPRISRNNAGASCQ